MNLFLNFFGKTKDIKLLNLLHILNDGSKVGLVILLPFIAKDLHINLIQVGLLGTILNVCLILFAIPAGYFSTRIGGFKTLLIALLFYALGYFATGFVSSYVNLFCTFFIAGIGFGMFHPIALILLTEWVDKRTRGREMGNFTALGDIGTVGIPIILVFLIPFFGWRSVALSFGILMGLVCIFLYKRQPAKKEEYVSSKQKQVKSFFWFLKHKQFLLVAAVGGLDAFASGSLFIFLPFFLLRKGISSETLGMFAAVFFIGSFIGKAFLGRFVDTFGNKKVFILSELSMAILIILLTQVNSFILIMVIAVILGGFTKGTAPVSATMLSDVIDKEGHAEKAFGINGVLQGVAISISPALLGVISDKFSIIIAFYTMAFVAVCAAIPAIFLTKYESKVLVTEELKRVG
ncbi:MAG TPA: MFS transporter [Candidatus Saccharimonadales bacterium]|nr:MFS transporter [Candidatus Saccharimonadales bacterium]